MSDPYQIQMLLISTKKCIFILRFLLLLPEHRVKKLTLDNA